MRGRDNPFTNLTSYVEDSGHTLDYQCYQEIKNLFLSEFAASSEKLGQYTTELDKSEFLVCVNDEGELVETPLAVVDDYQRTLQQHPSFEKWFREAKTGESGVRILLVGRWLCHLVGLRHLSVHLFIDLPAAGNLTLIQVRSSRKAKSPGCFDLPVAGHRASLDSIQETLVTEIREEAGLALGNLDRLTAIGEYNYNASPKSKDFPDNEYRVVYRCRLKQDKLLSTLRLAEEEVAAMSIFSIAELKMLITAFPERTASGLASSFPIYINDLDYSEAKSQNRLNSIG